MVKRELKDCKPYQAPKHFGMTAIRLQGKDESGTSKFWMGMSHFLPGGGAEYDETPTEKVYFCVSGEVAVYDKDQKNRYLLKANDSIFIGPNEGRSIVNESNLPATTIVVINYPN